MVHRHEQKLRTGTDYIVGGVAFAEIKRDGRNFRLILLDGTKGHVITSTNDLPEGGSNISFLRGLKSKRVSITPSPRII